MAWLVVGAAVISDVVSRPTPTVVPSVTPRIVIIVPSATPSAPPTLTATPELLSATPTVTPPHPVTATPWLLVPSATASDSAASTATPMYVIVTGAPCTPPAGWVAYRVEEGDTLFGFQLGADNQVDVAAIMAANCLDSRLLSIGQVIFLPPGVAEKSPKVDDSAVAGDPNGGSTLTRPANCPCTVRVRAGWRLEQIAAAVDRLPAGFRGADFLAATGAAAGVPGEFGFLASRPGGRSLEGFMLPGDYTLDNTTTAVDFRNMMLSAFAAGVGGDVQGGFAAQGLSVWEAVNMASIIQRESYDPESQKIIASIFFNRRARGMALGSYAGLQYAYGRPGDWWPRLTRSMLDADSPYKLTVYRGLPPTPISNPGLSALLAVAFPAQTDYLYFNAGCNGGNVYARTYEEFRQTLNCN